MNELSPLQRTTELVKDQAWYQPYPFNEETLLPLPLSEYHRVDKSWDGLPCFMTSSGAIVRPYQINLPLVFPQRSFKVLFEDVSLPPQFDGDIPDPTGRIENASAELLFDTHIRHYVEKAMGNPNPCPLRICSSVLPPKGLLTSIHCFTPPRVGGNDRSQWHTLHPLSQEECERIPGWDCLPLFKEKVGQLGLYAPPVRPYYLHAQGKPNEPVLLSSPHGLYKGPLILLEKYQTPIKPHQFFELNSNEEIRTEQSPLFDTPLKNTINTLADDLKENLAITGKTA